MNVNQLLRWFVAWVFVWAVGLLHAMPSNGAASPITLLRANVLDSNSDRSTDAAIVDEPSFVAGVAKCLVGADFTHGVTIAAASAGVSVVSFTLQDSVTHVRRFVFYCLVLSYQSVLLSAPNLCLPEGIFNVSLADPNATHGSGAVLPGDSANAGLGSDEGQHWVIGALVVATLVAVFVGLLLRQKWKLAQSNKLLLRLLDVERRALEEDAAQHERQRTTESSSGRSSGGIFKELDPKSTSVASRAPPPATIVPPLEGEALKEDDRKVITARVQREETHRGTEGENGSAAVVGIESTSGIPVVVVAAAPTPPTQSPRRVLPPRRRGISIADANLAIAVATIQSMDAAAWRSGAGIPPMEHDNVDAEIHPLL